MVNIKICSPLKLCSGMTGNYQVIRYCSYNNRYLQAEKKELITHIHFDAKYKVKNFYELISKSKYKNIKSNNNHVTAAGIPFAVTVTELMKTKVKN